MHRIIYSMQYLYCRLQSGVYIDMALGLIPDGDVGCITKGSLAVDIIPPPDILREFTGVCVFVAQGYALI